MNPRIALCGALALALAGAIWWFLGVDASEPAETASPGESAARASGERDARELPALPAAAEASGAGAAQRTDQPADSTTIDMTGARAVVGSVAFATGGPAIHAWIAAAPDDGAPIKGRELYSESGADGRYSIRVPPGRFTISARHAGTGTARAPLDVPRGDGEVRGPTLVLDEGGVIAGRVFENDGTPLPGFIVRAAAAGGMTRFATDHGTPILLGGDEAVTDADGAFRLKGLEREAKHAVSVELLPRTDVRCEPERFADVVPATGAAKSLVFTVRAKRAIEGVVIAADTREPIPTFRIDGRLQRDPRGHFEVAVDRAVAPTFEALGFVTQERDDLRIKDGERRYGLTIAMERSAETGTLVVHAVDDRGGPVTKFDVLLNRVGADWDVPVEAADGTAILSGVDAGDWRGAVRSSVHRGATFTTTIAAGGRGTVEVTLARGSPVDLEVKDADGAPWSGDVAIAAADGSGPEWRFLPTGKSPSMSWVREVDVQEAKPPERCSLESASGTIEGLAAGRYELVIFARDEDRRVQFEVFAETRASVRVKL